MIRFKGTVREFLSSKREGLVGDLVAVWRPAAGAIWERNLSDLSRLVRPAGHCRLSYPRFLAGFGFGRWRRVVRQSF
jgi:hypothetical protein